MRRLLTIDGVRQVLVLAAQEVADELTEFFEAAQRTLTVAQWRELVPYVTAVRSAVDLQARSIEALLQKYRELRHREDSRVIDLRPELAARRRARLGLAPTVSPQPPEAS